MSISGTIIKIRRLDNNITTIFRQVGEFQSPHVDVIPAMPNSKKFIAWSGEKKLNILPLPYNRAIGVARRIFL